jgi:hypothetical protein
MGGTFAHLAVKKHLEKKGVYGQFSFKLCGYAAYLSYMLKDSAKKLPVDIDRKPFSWPPVPIGKLDEIVAKMSSQMAARNAAPVEQSAGRGRKRTPASFCVLSFQGVKMLRLKHRRVLRGEFGFRVASSGFCSAFFLQGKLLTFSELTDAFVEHKVRSEQDDGHRQIRANNSPRFRGAQGPAKYRHDMGCTKVGCRPCVATWFGHPCPPQFRANVWTNLFVNAGCLAACEGPQG